VWRSLDLFAKVLHEHHMAKSEIQCVGAMYSSIHEDFALRQYNKLVELC
jgi:hypothetical protein